jgi:hypothetical protein
LSKGGVGNINYNTDHAYTTVNFGSNCTTGYNGGDYGSQSIGGGADNRATLNYSTIGGGQGNHAEYQWTTVGGGWKNNAWGMYGFVGGGWKDTARAEGSAVVGGIHNVVSYNANSSAIGGGEDNLIESWDLTEGTHSVIAGGKSNQVSLYGNHSCIGAGTSNYINDDHCFIGSGNLNRVLAHHSVVPTGNADTIASSAGYSMALGRGVYVSDSFQVHLYDDTYPGFLRLNRDSRNGTSTYPIHVGADGATSTGNGAYLTGGGTWTNGSSRDFKDNFAALDGTRLLSSIWSMPIESWTYRNSTERHIGPVAEDFVAAFDVGAVRDSDGLRDDHYLAASDVAGVALAGVKELVERNRLLEQRVAELEAMVQRLLEQKQ